MGFARIKELLTTVLEANPRPYGHGGDFTLNAAAAGLSGALATIATQPFDVLKTRKQVGERRRGERQEGTGGAQY